MLLLIVFSSKFTSVPNYSICIVHSIAYIHTYMCTSLPVYIEELLQSITESVESGDLPDAALEEKGLCFPSGLASLSRDTDLENFSHGRAVCSSHSTPSPSTSSSIQQLEAVKELGHRDAKSRISDSVSTPDPKTRDSVKMSSRSPEDTICSDKVSRTSSRKEGKYMTKKQQGRKKLHKRKQDVAVAEGVF